MKKIKDKRISLIIPREVYKEIKKTEGIKGKDVGNYITGIIIEKFIKEDVTNEKISPEETNFKSKKENNIQQFKKVVTSLYLDKEIVEKVEIILTIKKLKTGVNTSLSKIVNYYLKDYVESNIKTIENLKI